MLFIYLFINIIVFFLCETYSQCLSEFFFSVLFLKQEKILLSGNK